MYLFELEKSDLDTPYYDSEEDKYGVRNLSDTRKPKIFLKTLNRLKKIRAMQELERVKREDLLSVMYGVPDESAGGPGGGMGF